MNPLGLFLPLDVEWLTDDAVLGLSGDAELLWIRAQGLCKRRLSDGVVTLRQLRTLTTRMRTIEDGTFTVADLIGELEAEGLFEPTGPDEWLIPWFVAGNASAAEVEDQATGKRAAAAERSRRYRERHNVITRDVTRDAPLRDASSHVTNAPSRPTETETETETQQAPNVHVTSSDDTVPPNGGLDDSSKPLKLVKETGPPKEAIAVLALVRSKAWEMDHREPGVEAEQAIRKAWPWAVRADWDEGPLGYLTAAIKGARYDPDYTGHTDRAKVYDGWDNLLRNADRIEQHARLYLDRRGKRPPPINRTGHPLPPGQLGTAGPAPSYHAPNPLPPAPPETTPEERAAVLAAARASRSGA